MEMRAGWNKVEPSLWASPRTKFLPFRWEWGKAKEALDQAGELISAEKAERRNLFLVNPCEDNFYETLRTLVSAYQMILPGEVARSHRHTPNALRLVVDVADGCFTVVDGVELEMRTGDVLLTPGWAWHGHGNRGSQPGYWIDFLDVPLVQLLEPMFLENHPAGLEPAERATRDSPFVIPFETSRSKLEASKPDATGRIRAVLDSEAMPTIGMEMERLASGQVTARERTTANQIIAIVSGEGVTRIGNRELTWRSGDVLSIPSWHDYEHKALEESFTFCVSDRQALQRLNFHRVIQS
jgi:gentisate 1,2-dioxygenase